MPTAAAYSAWSRREGPPCTAGDMLCYAEERGRGSGAYAAGDRVRGANRMGRYDYRLAVAPARSAADLRGTYSLKSGERRCFAPGLHPRDMLLAGVFEGAMLNDCLDEFPADWFLPALTASPRSRLSPGRPDAALNRFRTKSRQSLARWRRQRDWILGDDERGWFQWFCRYALGRRCPEVDAKQMRRWAGFVSRMGGMLDKHPTDRIRQALLQWSPPPERLGALTSGAP